MAVSTGPMRRVADVSETLLPGIFLGPFDAPGVIQPRRLVYLLCSARSHFLARATIRTSLNSPASTRFGVPRTLKLIDIGGNPRTKQTKSLRVKSSPITFA